MSKLIFLSFPFLCYAQQNIKQEKRFQFSLVPALGTNGLQPGSFTNYISINITSGYSAKNLVFEMGGISNLNTSGTRGLQFAGIANITGANAFSGLSKKEKDQKLKTGFNSHLFGAQFSGVTNIVIDEIFGAQITGGFNLGKNALIGFQAAGVANFVYKYTLGVQIGGLWNVSVASMDGLQLSGLMNYTAGGLYGMQLGLINRAGYTEGKNSFENKNPWGLQLGLINIADRMNGFQFGLINISKQSQGTQIGLVNIYRRGKVIGTKDGTAIGLVNIGDVGYTAIYANELFALNYEIATGNRKNGRVKLDSKNTYLENALIYSHSAFDKGSWAIGYGLKKMFFSRSDLPGMTEFRFLSYGIDLQHINFSPGEFTKALSLLLRLKLEIGSRLSPKLNSVYLYGAISYNAYLTDTGNKLAPEFLTTGVYSDNQIFELWPGLSVGILLH
ncbi:MAG: hypothetical protein ORN54_06260 [Cyclobacteriaceae bacterium]|nr:hypothetical protein [Cyclobacteriaceae bacterium]